MLQKQAFQGPSPRLVGAAPEANRVVSRSGEIAVIRDLSVSRLDTVEQLLTRHTGPRRLLGRSAKTATMWLLGLAQAVLLVGGLAVLLSCRFVADATVATNRSYLGIGLVFAAALVTVPATALMGGRGGRPRGSHARGRHRRSR